MKRILFSLALAGAAALSVAAAPKSKAAPVAEGYVDWQGVVDKNHVMGRFLCPSDLRHKVVVLLEAEVGTSLQDALAQFGGIAELDGITGAPAVGNWETAELPRNVLCVVSLVGFKSMADMKAALTPPDGADEAYKKGLANIQSPSVAVYTGLDFPNKPDAEGKRPYVYVMGPTGKEPLYQGALDAAGVNPYSDVLTLEKYRELFGVNKHPFTGVDYVEYYQSLITGCGAEAEIIFANQPRAILPYADCIINCDIHTRQRTKRILREAGAKVVCGLDDIMTAPVNGSGCNERYGLLGSNKATEDSIKLFPRECKALVLDIQSRIQKETGKQVEVMVYGDGAFKDPQGKIWELADPVVSPAFTDGLIGTPNELKLKYLADNDFKELSGEALKQAISASIKEKDANLVGNMASEGTTPRQLTDLIGSLCDLTSGSGDKGTPVVLVQGYFDNYTND